MSRNPIPARASRTQAYDLLPDIQEEDDYYPKRSSSSAIRYQTTNGSQDSGSCSSAAWIAMAKAWSRSARS